MFVMVPLPVILNSTLLAVSGTSKPLTWAELLLLLELSATLQVQVCPEGILIVTDLVISQIEVDVMAPPKEIISPSPTAAITADQSPFETTLVEPLLRLKFPFVEP